VPYDTTTSQSQVGLDGQPTGVREVVGDRLLLERGEPRRQVAAVDLSGRPPQDARELNDERRVMEVVSWPMLARLRWLRRPGR
jgi:hypothetical protein